MENNFDVIIVGAGISGLSAAHFLAEQKPGLKIAIVDKSDRAGGLIRTFRDEGYQAEWGPHGFLNNTPESRGMLRDIGLEKEMQTAPLGDFRRFICFNGRLEALPQNPKMLLSTPLLTSTPKGSTAAIACAILSGPSPPARNTGSETALTIRAAAAQSHV